MAEINATHPNQVTNHCEFYGTCLCSHAQKTIPMAPFHSFTKPIVAISSLHQD